MGEFIRNLFQRKAAAQSGGYINFERMQMIMARMKTYFVRAESGKGLSENDYTTAEKEKLASLEEKVTELEKAIQDCIAMR